jgi:hypothetical protein
MNSVEDLDVFKLAHQLALRIYSVPKSFPGEETYSLVDQMRRAFREFILLSGWNDLNGSRANAATWRLSVSPGERLAGVKKGNRRAERNIRQYRAKDQAKSKNPEF